MDSNDILTSSRDRISHYRLLYIDDAPSIRTAVTFLYRAFGCQIEVAEDGPSGVEKVRQNDFDIVISDFTMPLMNGREVAKAIKAIRSETTVVLVTGWPLNEIPSAPEEEACEDFLFEKPFNIEKLTMVVDELEK